MKGKPLGFIGAGRVTRIILGGFQRKGLAFAEIIVSDAQLENISALQAKCPTFHLTVGDNSRVAKAEIVFLALHPPALPAVLEEIKVSLAAKTIIVSLAPKVSMAQISGMLGGFARIARMIPNAPAVVNSGYNPIAFSGGLGKDDRESLLELLSPLGEVPVVAEESLEAYAVLAAMGPTYFWFQWQELESIGERLGLKPGEARAALSAMVTGAEKTYFHSGLKAVEVMDLIPVRPLKDDEQEIRAKFRQRLEALHAKIKP